jgi:hypothetical protein
MQKPRTGGSKLVEFFTSFDYIQIASMAVLLAIGVVFIILPGFK